MHFLPLNARVAVMPNHTSYGLLCGNNPAVGMELLILNGVGFVYENYVRKFILNPKFDSRFNLGQKKLLKISLSTRVVVESLY